MKKKIMGLLLVGALLLSLTACAETPEQLVVQKDGDRLEQQAQLEPTGNSLRDIAENLPERYIWQETSKDGSVSISADAEIWVPDLDTMPSYTAEGQVWCQEQHGLQIVQQHSLHISSWVAV